MKVSWRRHPRLDVMAPPGRKEVNCVDCESLKYANVVYSFWSKGHTVYWRKGEEQVNFLLDFLNAEPIEPLTLMVDVFFVFSLKIRDLTKDPWIILPKIPEISVLQISSGSHFFGVGFLHVFLSVRDKSTPAKNILGWMNFESDIEEQEEPTPKNKHSWNIWGGRFERFLLGPRPPGRWKPWVFWECFLWGELFPT